jgi:hypothetical protein
MAVKIIGKSYDVSSLTGGYQHSGGTHHLHLHNPEYGGNMFPLNIMVEWLTLLLHIQEVPSSNLGPETGYTR